MSAFTGTISASLVKGVPGSGKALSHGISIFVARVAINVYSVEKWSTVAALYIFCKCMHKGREVGGGKHYSRIKRLSYL